METIQIMTPVIIDFPDTWLRDRKNARDAKNDRQQVQLYATGPTLAGWVDSYVQLANNLRGKYMNEK